MEEAHKLVRRVLDATGEALAAMLGGVERTSPTAMAQATQAVESYVRAEATWGAVAFEPEAPQGSN